MSIVDDMRQHVAQVIQQETRSDARLLLALSGGVDSVVLLHLVNTLVQGSSRSLQALHVHHGISRYADDWCHFCTELCAAWAISCEVVSVDIRSCRQQGVEAAARQLRYQVLQQREADYILLGHHADDQAETVLLQLMRGCGVKGAAAMPLLARQSHGGHYLRPLLKFSRQQIIEYATAMQLSWVEDDSNSDTAYARNFVRAEVMPVLQRKFPHYRQSLLRSSALFAESAQLLDELAQQDAGVLSEAPVLSLERLAGLSESRMKNLLRYFIARHGAPMPQAVQLQQVLQQLHKADQGGAICVSFAGWQLRSYQRNLYLISALPALDSAFCRHWHPGMTVVTWPLLHASLQVTELSREASQCIAPACLTDQGLEIRCRRGGERLRLHRHAPRKTLKNLLQQAGIPPWERDRIPLIFQGEELIAVPGIGVDCRFQPACGQSGFLFQLCRN